MDSFSVAYSDSEDWAHAAKECADRLGQYSGASCLGFVYVTEPLADDFASILTYLRQKTGVNHWVGSVGMGVFATDVEYFDRPGLVAMVGRLPEGQFQVFQSISESVDQLSEETRDWIDAHTPHFGIVHGDPHNINVPALIEDLAEKTNGFLVGGITSGRATSHQVADRITGGGVSGVLFSPAVTVATGLTQGCAPIGEHHVISDSMDNIIIGLDGRNALAVFKEDVGELLARNLHRVPGYVHAAFLVEGSDTGDYMVRDLVGIDQSRGWLGVATQVSQGERVMFVTRDANTAHADMIEQMKKMKRRLPSTPRGGLYVSCHARGANMFGGEGGEIALIRKHLGTFPLVGFHSGAEISNGRFYGYTGILTLFF